MPGEGEIWLYTAHRRKNGYVNGNMKAGLYVVGMRLEEEGQLQSLVCFGTRERQHLPAGFGYHTPYHTGRH